jgi:hypothetical protein
VFILELPMQSDMGHHLVGVPVDSRMDAVRGRILPDGGAQGGGQRGRPGNRRNEHSLPLLRCDRSLNRALKPIIGSVVNLRRVLAENGVPSLSSGSSSRFGSSQSGPAALYGMRERRDREKGSHHVWKREGR